MCPMLVYFGNNASDCNTVTHDRHLDHRINVTDCVREKLSVNEVSFIFFPKLNTRRALLEPYIVVYVAIKCRN